MKVLRSGPVLLERRQRVYAQCEGIYLLRQLLLTRNLFSVAEVYDRF